jgi:hypothetical protein
MTELERRGKAERVEERGRGVTQRAQRNGTESTEKAVYLKQAIDEGKRFKLYVNGLLE